jgi:hypothetical protein
MRMHYGKSRMAGVMLQLIGSNNGGVPREDVVIARHNESFLWRAETGEVATVPQTPPLVWIDDLPAYDEMEM